MTRGDVGRAALAVDRALNGSVSRRRFLRVAGLGAAGLTMTSLLAACADDADDDEAAAEEPEPDQDDSDEIVDEGDDEAEPDDDPDEEEIDEEPDDTATDDADDDADEPDDEPQHGGTLHLALASEPPPIDIHKSTAGSISFVGWHIYEPLFTWDEDLVLVPDLVDTHEVSDDSLTQTFRLREGVPFHNGDIMNAEDVVASIERWFEDRDTQDDIVSIEAVDDLVVEVETEEPFASLSAELARRNHGAAIYPASLVAEYGNEIIPTLEVIGTGPYRMVDFQSDQYIHLERFDDYVGRTEEESGYWGQKNQYVDEIYFYPVPDEAAMTAGIRTGEFDFLRDLSADQSELLDDDENVEFELLPPREYSQFTLNMQEGILSDVTMRKAVQAALDLEEIALASLGDGNYRLDPSLMLQEFSAWYTTSGEEYYNQADPELAAEYLEEAGYDGEIIRFVVPESPQYMYNGAVMATQQLEEAGMEIDMQVVDFATLGERRQDPGDWDMFSSANSVPGDPVMHNAISPRYPGWWELEEKEELRAELARETDHERRFEIWEEIQYLFYEDVNLIKIADMYVASARSPRLRNFNPTGLAEYSFWNVWLDDED